MREILEALNKSGFKTSTNTREDVSGKVFFAIKGNNFDGNIFAPEAIDKGALAAVVDNPKIKGDKIYFVENAINAFQESANLYRKLLKIPIIIVGGSNGKTLSKEIIREVLGKKYRVCATEGNLNSQIGVPKSLLQIDKDADLAVLEVGASNPGEHARLMEIIEPNFVVVTNNGLDHLEGFGSPEGVRRANREIYEWARANKATAFVNKSHPDLMEDSEGLERKIYSTHDLSVVRSMPLVLKFGSREYETNLVGAYNLENIALALALGEYFEVSSDMALEAVSKYVPSSKRSQFMKVRGVNVILDCYNANPSSMRISLESFFNSAKGPRGVILGDMLELGRYAEEEHKKIVEYVFRQKLDSVIFIGSEFKRALVGTDFKYSWFPDSEKAAEWFKEQVFDDFTFLLKGSRGIAVEKVLGI